ncbi:hypothetical protein KUCAC02_029748, partial [Chaenocephalus aceratus]
MDARAAGTSRRARRRSRKKTQQPLLKLREEQRSRGTSECTSLLLVCRGTHAQWEQEVITRSTGTEKVPLRLGPLCFRITWEK